MTLDGSYFNNLELNLIKRKYYDAKAVDDALVDIRQRAVAQTEEIAQLKARCEEYEKQKDEISEAVIASREAYKDIVEKANKQAEKIVADAENKAKAIKQEIAKTEEFYISKVEKMYSKLHDSQSAAIEDLNGLWQDFLVSLSDEGQSENAPVSSVEKESLSEKISEIADSINDI